jgi:hypothetical protein
MTTLIVDVRKLKEKSVNYHFYLRANINYSQINVKFTNRVRSFESYCVKKMIYRIDRFDFNILVLCNAVKQFNDKNSLNPFEFLDGLNSYLKIENVEYIFVFAHPRFPPEINHYINKF